jgi:hypothetical protein
MICAVAFTRLEKHRASPRRSRSKCRLHGKGGVCWRVGWAPGRRRLQPSPWRRPRWLLPSECGKACRRALSAARRTSHQSCLGVALPHWPVVRQNADGEYQQGGAKYQVGAARRNAGLLRGPPGLRGGDGPGVGRNRRITDQPSAQVTIVGNDDMAAPGISLEVADVDAVHGTAVERGFEIVYPSATRSGQSGASCSASRAARLSPSCSIAPAERSAGLPPRTEAGVWHSVAEWPGRRWAAVLADARVLPRSTAAEAGDPTRECPVSAEPMPQAGGRLAALS